MFYGVIHEAEEPSADLKALKSDISKSISKIKQAQKKTSTGNTSKLLQLLLKAYTKLHENVNKPEKTDTEEKIAKLQKSYDSLEKKREKAFTLIRIKSGTTGAMRKAFRLKK